MPSLRVVDPSELPSLRDRRAVEPAALETARTIVNDVRDRGEPALREHAERLGDVEAGAPLFLGPEMLKEALRAEPEEHRDLLERVAERIRRFAAAQRDSLKEIDVPVPGGRAGHWISPVERAGCYAPGGRFPLPSTVLMTAVTARVAGVEEIWVASPRPAPITLAAAALAGVDGFLVAGGAQAIAALAYGAGAVPPNDVVVGPGNRYVTAAKKVVAGQVGIDMLAGPSELVVLADDSAAPSLVAADLLAQAEHDPDALPILVTPEPTLITRVNEELSRQLADLSTAATAELSLERGFAVLVSDIDEGVKVCDRIAPEHLELHLRRPREIARRCRHFGAVFIGDGAAEVLGDYGVGPNHTLPTGGAARHTGGLSVLTFLRVRTWLIQDDEETGLLADSEALAELEGLAGHARSAGRRRRGSA